MLEYTVVSKVFVLFCAWIVFLFIHCHRPLLAYIRTVLPVCLYRKLIQCCKKCIELLYVNEMLDLEVGNFPSNAIQDIQWSQDICLGQKKK